MNRLSAVIPGTLDIITQEVAGATRTYYLHGGERYEDGALLRWCGASEYLGGRVERDEPGKTKVVVYTD